MAESFSPLYDPDRDALGYTVPLDTAIERAREALVEYANSNIHDHNEMLRAAVGLEMRLRSLVDSLDADRAR